VYHALFTGCRPAFRVVKRTVLTAVGPFKPLGKEAHNLTEVGLNYGRPGTEATSKRTRHGTSLGGIPREQEMLQGHLSRVIYHRVYFSVCRQDRQVMCLQRERRHHRGCNVPPPRSITQNAFHALTDRLFEKKVPMRASRRSSQVNLHHAIMFRVLRGSNLVTVPSEFGGN